MPTTSSKTTLKPSQNFAQVIEFKFLELVYVPLYFTFDEPLSYFQNPFRIWFQWESTQFMLS